MRCNGVGSYEFVIRCGWLRCHVVWFEVVVWGDLEDDLVIRTTQYYSVLLQYCSVLKSTTPYYNVLLQYYSVLQSTTPVLFCTTKYYSSIVLCTTKYCSVLQSTTPALLFTLRGATGLIFEGHQILHLPRKMTLKIDVRHV